MHEIPALLKQQIDTSPSEAEANQPHNSSLDGLNLRTSQESYDLAYLADELEGLVEYMGRIKPALKFCVEEAWATPASLISLVNRVSLRALNLTGLMSGPEFRSDSVKVLKVAHALPELFNPESEAIENRLEYFDALTTGIEDSLNSVEYELCVKTLEIEPTSELNCSPELEKTIQATQASTLFKRMPVMSSLDLLRTQITRSEHIERVLYDKLGVEKSSLIDDIESELFDNGEKTLEVHHGKEVHNVLRDAEKLALQRESRYVGNTDVLLAIFLAGKSSEATKALSPHLPGDTYSDKLMNLKRAVTEVQKEIPSESW